MGWFEIYSTEATKAHTFKAETQTCFMLLFAMSLPILGVWALHVITETESLQKLQVHWNCPNSLNMVSAEHSGCT